MLDGCLKGNFHGIRLPYYSPSTPPTSIESLTVCARLVEHGMTVLARLSWLIDVLPLCDRFPDNYLDAVNA
jgi:hypothetical protein